MTLSPEKSPLFTDSPDTFADRHIGPRTEEIGQMLDELGHASLDALTAEAVPRDIALDGPLDLPAPLTEAEALKALRTLLSRNRVLKSFLGMGYHDTIVPPVIQRNIFENPGWYTQYTPYQAEIAQGRLEALLNFQTMVSELTGMEISNASLLDEGTAAAEGMALCHAVRENAAANRFFIADDCHPQTILVVRTRAEVLGWEIVIGDWASFTPDATFFGWLSSYPTTTGRVVDLTAKIEAGHKTKTLAVVVADLLSLTLLKPPGEMGADVVVGNSQRFGVPLGYGGPHAAFFATRTSYQRRMPGRIVGVSRDRDGRAAIRLVLQTREQHIRRDKATSNICTAQVLLAVMAGMYAVYHGPEGLKRIAGRIHSLTVLMAAGLKRLGFQVSDEPFFDTLRVTGGSRRFADIVDSACSQGMNLRSHAGAVGIAFDETTTEEDVARLLMVFAGSGKQAPSLVELKRDLVSPIPATLRRATRYLTHPVFHRYRSETEMLRYIRSLEAKDLSLTHSMIPLGSCTMKLNASAEMFPVTWPEVSRLHPFVSVDQAAGYRSLFADLEKWLAELTGFKAVSLQPNSGAQGEYAGLLVIRAHHRDHSEPQRNVCLIPRSAHGTNPASAVMAGMQVVTIECDDKGNIDVADLKKKADAHAPKLAALMVTYPSTHGVFEESIREICDVVHKHGGLVYLDGANLNAQVGLCRPGDYGADVCHLNLHKTFCIPHGGGGPGMGPIAVAPHLAAYLPTHPVVPTGGERAIGPVSAAPWGSASILPISWMYIAMMGAEGMKRATGVAILNANYIAKRLEKHFPILFRGNRGLVAHECIVDLRDLKKQADVEVEDVAKRLIDYGYHAPTISWPVPGTMMIEPTESESKEEIDKFCDAMISIYAEAMAIAEGKADRVDNVLKNAPHTAHDLTLEPWSHPYSREEAVFPSAATRERKFWPPVSRIDNAYGDRHLFCSCPPIEESAPKK